jgi:Holliday junction DNA helicase RuvA
MISFVRGSVVSAGVDSVVVDLGPIGVRVHCTPGTALGLRQGDHVELMTTLVIREDGWTVYGFAEEDERGVFEKVHTVLTRVPGIGRKGAQRLILELADRLGPAIGAAPLEQAETARPTEAWQQAVAAGLMSLGWSGKEADSAVAALDEDVVAAGTAAEPPDIGMLLKAALRGLDRS